MISEKEDYITLNELKEYLNQFPDDIQIYPISSIEEMKECFYLSNDGALSIDIPE